MQVRRRDICGEGQATIRSTRRERTGLSKRFVQDDSHRRRKIQTSYTWIEHRYRQTSLPVRSQQVLGQTTRLAAEDKTLVTGELPVGVAPFRFSGQIKKSRCRK